MIFQPWEWNNDYIIIKVCTLPLALILFGHLGRTAAKYPRYYSNGYWRKYRWLHLAIFDKAIWLDLECKWHPSSLLSDKKTFSQSRSTYRSKDLDWLQWWFEPESNLNPDYFYRLWTVWNYVDNKNHLPRAFSKSTSCNVALAQKCRKGLQYFASLYFDSFIRNERDVCRFRCVKSNQQFFL